MSNQQAIVVLGANIANFQSAMSTVQSSMNSTANNIQSAMNGAEQSTTNSVGGIKSALSGIAGLLAGAFAVDKIKDFVVSSIEAGAESDAMGAQFSAVFGDIQKDAQKTINGLGKDFGMVPNRVKPALTQMTSMFKGLGMDTKTAMSTAKKSVTLTADAAAFYDKSFEDANSALNSFIKGNYEGGESIGLFANETQLASWSSKNLGVDWKTLNEAGKQTTRLKFAEAMQKAAGATGQAKRESNSYQNQLGNLKQSWTDMKAKLGKPFLTPVINALKNLANGVGNIDTTAIVSTFKNVGGYLKDILVPTFEDVKTGLQFLWDKFKDSGGLETAKGLFEGLKDALGFVRDHAEIVTAALAGLAGGFAAFKIITTINTAIGIFTTLMTALRTGTLMATLAQWGFNTALLANPIVWIAIAIGALIAIVVLLWKNWDKVSKWLSNSWTAIKAKASEVWNGMKKVMSTVWDAIKTKVSVVWNGIKSVLSGIWNGIKAVAMAVWNGIKTYFSTVLNFYKNLFKSAWNGIKSVTVSVWNGIKSGISKAISGIKSVFTSMWNKASEIAGKIKGAFGNLFGGIKLPHFSISGSLNPATWLKSGMPKIGVNWYANGGIFKGNNGGSLIGVGENGGDEAVLPLSNKTRMKPFALAVADMMPDKKGKVVASGGDYTFTIPVYLEGREIARGTATYMQSELDKINKRNNRMGGTV